MHIGLRCINTAGQVAMLFMFLLISYQVICRGGSDDTWGGDYEE